MIEKQFRDCVRIYFSYNNQLYEKLISFLYPEKVLNNKEQEEAFRWNFTCNTCLPELKRWYKEVTGQDYPLDSVPVRDIHSSNIEKLQEILNKSPLEKI